jgi:hypothetical protein
LSFLVKIRPLGALIVRRRTSPVLPGFLPEPLRLPRRRAYDQAVQIVAHLNLT